MLTALGGNTFSRISSSAHNRMRVRKRSGRIKRFPVFSREEIDFKMNCAACDDRVVGAAFTFVEADKASGREFVKRT